MIIITKPSNYPIKTYFKLVWQLMEDIIKKHWKISKISMKIP
jgi:hypothetical protein